MAKSKTGKAGRPTPVVDSSSQAEGALARAGTFNPPYDWYSGPVHQYCVTETRRANRI